MMGGWRMIFCRRCVTLLRIQETTLCCSRVLVEQSCMVVGEEKEGEEKEGEEEQRSST